MSQIYVKPVPGRASPVPEKGGALLPEVGDSVPHNAYWQRRIKDGDVVVQVKGAKVAREGKA